MSRASQVRKLLSLLNQAFTLAGSLGMFHTTQLIYTAFNSIPEGRQANQ